MLSRRFGLATAVALAASLTLAAQAPQKPAAAARGVARSATRGTIQTADLKHWLTDISSDAFEGRGDLQEGLGLAAGYIAGELKTLHVQPAGDNGSYFQTVKLNGVNTTSRSSVTVEVNGQTKTFKDGDAVTFPKKAGGNQTLVFDDVEFLGYGLDAPAVNYSDYTGKNVKGKLVLFMGANGPKALQQPAGAGGMRRSPLGGRAQYATDSAGAAAVIGPGRAPFTPQQMQAAAAAGMQVPAGQPAAAGQAGAGRGGQPGAVPAAAGRGGQPGQAAGFGGGRGQALPSADYTTTERLDKKIAPSVTLKADDDSFYEAVLAAAPVKYADLKAKAAAGDTLPTFTLKNVKVTVRVDMTYDIVSTQLTHNVIGVIPGSDPALKGTYVVFGAHYDHLGYQAAPPQPRPAGQGRQGGAGQPAAPADPAEVHERRAPAAGDRTFNGADDDGSGSAALLALAKVFLNGPRPKRSLMFVWFAGEERGMWGSHYAADFGPGSDKLAAELNIDMIGRNEWDNPKEANTVYIIGSDRISTELHNMNVDANQGMAKPLALDYTFNDPSDTNRFYFRSDHYSYAGNGVPIIFYTTGEHRDYHQLTDEVTYIEWEKYTRIVQLIHDTGLKVANLDHLPARDNKGPRAGKGTVGKITTN